MNSLKIGRPAGSRASASVVDSDTGTVDSQNAIPDTDDGLEFQIALDQLVTGTSTEPMNIYLARLRGLDPRSTQLVSSEFRANNSGTTETGSEFSYIGEVDGVEIPKKLVQFSEELESQGQPTGFTMDMGTGAFYYDSLDPARKQIRLLHFGQRDAEGIIRNLKLETFDLEVAPPFNCLSYVWGQPEKTIPLNCNGNEIFVTQNLFHGIKASLTRYWDTYLWADGVCINQEDPAERAQQVRMMGDIYSRAEIVTGSPGHYLYEVQQSVGPHRVEDPGLLAQPLQAPGTGPPLIEGTPPGIESDHKQGLIFNAQPAISLMNYLSRIWDFDGDFALKGDDDWKQHNLPDTSEENIEIWKTLFRFWNQDWFYRGWVLQEIVLGPKVVVLYSEAICSLHFIMKFWNHTSRRDPPEVLKHGPLAVEFARIQHLNPFAAVKKLRDVRETLASKNEELRNAINHDVQPRHQNFNLLDLLTVSRTHLCTDSRDKIYSLLGLASSADPITRSIIPDYSSSNTTANLYTYVAELFINDGQGLQLLHQGGLDYRIPGYLPSWVPDWTFQPRSILPRDLYKCSGSSRPSIKVLPPQEGRRSLKVRGVILDTITFTGMPWRWYSHNQSQEQFAPLKEDKEGNGYPPFTDVDARCLVFRMGLLAARENCAGTYSKNTQEDIEHALARTLVADIDWRGQRIGGGLEGKGEEEQQRGTKDAFWKSFAAWRRLYIASNDDATDADEQAATLRDRAREQGDTTSCIQVHQPGFFKWLWHFDTEKELNDLRKEAWRFEAALQEAHKGRRFCTTKGGYMCTAPYDAERGDVVVLLEGFSMPFVLRRVDGGTVERREEEEKEEEWRLVGDCYVHGIMDGEVIVDVADSADERGLEEEENGGRVGEEDSDGEKEHCYAVQTIEGVRRFNTLILI